MLNTAQVGYATALDVFIIICFMSVFTALIEFAFINFLDMFIRRLKHRDLVRVVTLNDMTRCSGLVKKGSNRRILLCFPSSSVLLWMAV